MCLIPIEAGGCEAVNNALGLCEIRMQHVRRESLGQGHGAHMLRYALLSRGRSSMSSHESLRTGSGVLARLCKARQLNTRLRDGVWAFACEDFSDFRESPTFNLISHHFYCPMSEVTHASHPRHDSLMALPARERAVLCFNVYVKI
jgi:hypothetical protein